VSEKIHQKAWLFAQLVVMLHFTSRELLTSL